MIEGCNKVLLLLFMAAGDIHRNPGPNNSIVHINVSRLYPKLNLIESELNTYDVIAVKETHLNQRVCNDGILMKGYKEPFHLDRSFNTWSGVAVYIKTIFGTYPAWKLYG